MGPKKSGCASKKLRKKRLASEYKTSLQWKKWFSPTSSNEGDKTNSQEGKTVSSIVRESSCSLNVSDSISDCSENHDVDDTIYDILEQVSVDEVISSHPGSSNEIEYSDPALWPIIDDSVRCCLIEKGPQQTILENSEYPVLDGRKLLNEWFFKVLPNGEKVCRKWMLYSKSKNVLFCFSCVLFKNLRTGITCRFSNLSKGFSNWRHLNPRISDHENSVQHRQSYIQWKDLEKGLKEIETIDANMQKAINTEKARWRHILKAGVDAIMFCAKNNLALRGHWSEDEPEVSGEKNSGIFLNTLELISHYDYILADHLAYVKSGRAKVSYMSPRIQNELISLIGGEVRKEIIARIKYAKYFSIMFDATPDVSHIEQLSQIIRYVKITNSKCTIEESFIDFIESHETTGQGLAMEEIQKLQADGLDMEDCRGQGYDNAAYMSGKYEGVQAHIKRISPLARFVPCMAHTLNLIGVHAAEVSAMMITFFGTVQSIFTYFSRSPGRWEKLMSVLETTLKGHCDTRWSSKKQAVTSLNKQFPKVYDVLETISGDRSLNRATVDGATSLLKHIDLNFICLLEFWSEILIKIDFVNKSLQAKDISIDVATKMLKGLTTSFNELRRKKVDTLIINAKEISKSIGIVSDFKEKRLRKKKKMPGEKADDEPQTPEAELERQCNQVYDSIISQLKNRYEAMMKLSQDFSFLNGYELSTMNLEDLSMRASNLALKYPNDVNRAEFMAEIECFKFQADAVLICLATATPLDLLNLIHKYSLEETYPNTNIALRIFLTLPVTVASCERSFSKLKLIKNYLRSSMGQERLSNMAIISIEQTIANTLSYDTLIDNFASLKARRVPL